MPDLKPCPFCGGKAEHGTIPMGGEDEGAHFIACTNSACGASTNLRFSLMDDARPLLAEQWNRRAPAGEPRVTLGGGYPGDHNGTKKWRVPGMVWMVAYGTSKEVRGMFDTPEQAHAFVASLEADGAAGVKAPGEPARYADDGYQDFPPDGGPVADGVALDRGGEQ